MNSDEESGLHYNRYRYYRPESGRYISADPLHLRAGLNLYAYAPNPLGWIDPLGLTTCQISSADKLAMGPAPDKMKNPHMHHIVREMAPKNWSKKDRGAIYHVQNLAKKYGMTDLNRDPRNFYWARNGGGAYTKKTTHYIRDQLATASKVGGKDGFLIKFVSLGLMQNKAFLIDRLLK
ncbi:RHS repeat-associated core domain-containing protein [Salmonella enterica]